MSRSKSGDRFPLPQRLAAFERSTDLPNWNRFAAVNDEFIDVHMCGEAARAVGQPDAFGMGNLRIAYQHAALHEWLDGRGDVAGYSCQFRAINHRGDRLTVWGRLTGAGELEGHPVSTVDLGVSNQDGQETTPAVAEVVLFDGPPAMPPLPSRAAVPSREPGVHLDAATIGWLGRTLPTVRSYPVGANDIRRWAQAVWYPLAPPDELMHEEAAARGPWGGLVAPRDFNPFAWNPGWRPDALPWMRGMGTEPGRRGLNGGIRCWHGAPVRPGDVIASDVTLIDAYERVGRLGPMLFLVDEARWINQDGAEVRLSHRTTIYY
jgi:acyl dehydratase